MFLLVLVIDSVGVGIGVGACVDIGACYR